MARILLTDDDDALRQTVAAALTEAGHTVVQARGAREALDLQRQNPADLLVTDLVMKEMDGTELLRRLRTFSPATPVIAMSGARQGRIYLNMAKLLGASRILAKPFTSANLLQLIDQVLANRQPASARPPAAE